MSKKKDDNWPYFPPDIDTVDGKNGCTMQLAAPVVVLALGLWRRRR